MIDIFATAAQPAYTARENLMSLMHLNQKQLGLILGSFLALPSHGSQGVAGSSFYLTEVPDYHWHAGCFGTASGNLIGFWDRHGFSDFYKGSTNKGLAPLNSNGSNVGINALWASQKGVDGRPGDKPGHMDDYYLDYEDTSPDPYTLLQRPEHAPDSIGDFIGLNQDKWQDLNGECDGNIDGYSFVFWDYSGAKRVNFTPSSDEGTPISDVQSGLRDWAGFCGYAAETFTQLSDFNPSIPSPTGFSFEDLKAEIDSGYPVLLFMQDFTNYSRAFRGRNHTNPRIHGMLAYGYTISDDGTPFVRYRTSWASGNVNFSAWNSANWTPEGILNLPLRGVIGFHPKPKITSAMKTTQGLQLRWHAPKSILFDEFENTSKQVQIYIPERAFSLRDPHFEPVGSPTPDLETTIPFTPDRETYFRIRVQTGSSSTLTAPLGTRLSTRETILQSAPETE